MRVTFPVPESASARNQVSSLVDIAFLLLIFFLVSTTILPTENDLPMALHPVKGESETKMEPVSVSVHADGSVWWGEAGSEVRVATATEGRDLRQFREMLAALPDGVPGAEVAVMLETDDQASHQRFVDVLNALNAEGITRVALRD